MLSRICLPNYVRSSVSSQIPTCAHLLKVQKLTEYTVYQTKPSSRFPSVLLRVNRSCMSLSGTTVDNSNGATFVQLTKHTHSTHFCHNRYTSLNEQLFTRLKPQIYTLRTKDHQDPNTEYQRSPRSTNSKPTSHSLTDSLLSDYPPSL